MPPKRLADGPFALSRVKRMIQDDEDIGRVSAGAVKVAARVLDVFLHEILERSAAIVKSEGSRMLRLNHIKKL
jgi:histone H3/H4